MKTNNGLMLRRSYFENYPYLFARDFLGVELHWYQIVRLILMGAKNKSRKTFYTLDDLLSERKFTFAPLRYLMRVLWRFEQMKANDSFIKINGIMFYIDFALTQEYLEELIEFSKVCDEDTYTAYIDSGGFMVIY